MTSYRCSCSPLLAGAACRTPDECDTNAIANRDVTTQQYDGDKVKREIIDPAEAAWRAQAMLVDALRDLVTQQEYEMTRLRKRATQLRETWEGKGVVFP